MSRRASCFVFFFLFANFKYFHWCWWLVNAGSLFSDLHGGREIFCPRGCIYQTYTCIFWIFHDWTHRLNKQPSSSLRKHVFFYLLTNIEYSKYACTDILLYRQYFAFYLLQPIHLITFYKILNRSLTRVEKFLRIYGRIYNYMILMRNSIFKNSVFSIMCIIITYYTFASRKFIVAGTALCSSLLVFWQFTVAHSTAWFYYNAEKEEKVENLVNTRNRIWKPCKKSNLSCSFTSVF